MVKKQRSEVPGFGAEIGKLRVQKKPYLSQPKLMRRVSKELEHMGLDEKEYSAQWLGRLETGNIVNVPRYVLNALSQGLRCSEWEHAKLILLADRNVLTDKTNNREGLRELYNYMMLKLYDDVSVIWDSMIDQMQTEELRDIDKMELLRTALEFAITEYQHNPSKPRLRRKR